MQRIHTITAMLALVMLFSTEMLIPAVESSDTHSNDAAEANGAAVQVVEEDIVSLRILLISEHTEKLRYRTADDSGDSWTVIDADNPMIYLRMEDKTSGIVYVQESKDGQDWSDSRKLKYDQSLDKWVYLEKQLPPVWVDSLETGGQVLYPLGPLENYLEKGYGGRVQINAGFRDYDALQLFSSLEYQYGVSDTERVQNLNELILGLGAGYSLDLTEKVVFIPEFSTGLLSHLPVGSVSSSGSESLHVYFDMFFGGAAKVKLRMNERMTLYAAPKLLAFPEKDAWGLLYSYHAGIAVSL